MLTILVVPPTDGDALPDIPVTSFKEQAKQTTQGQKEGSWFALIWAYLWASIWPGLLCLISFLAGHVDEILSKFVQVFTALQATDQPGFYDLTASIMEDLLGFPISGVEMRAASRKGGAVAGARAIGEKLMNQLRTELETSSQVTPESGIAAANAFLGFLTGFAIRQGNVDVITSFIPEEYRMLDGLRGYGEEMAKQLGLGRLGRRALTPLVQTLIADPMTWALNKKYHPIKLGQSEVLRLYTRKLVSEELFNEEMDYAGISDNRKQSLLDGAYTRLSISQAWTAFRWGLIDEDTLQNIAFSQGMNTTDAARIRTILRYQDADSDVQAMKAVLKAQMLAGDIDMGLFESAISSLPLADEEKTRYIDLAHQQMQLPRAHLTFAQISQAYVDGIIDLAALDQWLDDQGYSDDDHATLVYMTLLKFTNLEERKKVAQFTYDKQVAKAQAKGLPIPPPPAILSK